jgi:hypothetical protein
VVHKWLGLGLVVALAVGGCAQIEHHQQLTEPVGTTLTVPVGSALATINKEKDLPNIFGRADIYGRKVDAGLIKIIYKGRGRDGSALVEQVDVDVRSNASVMTRLPTTFSSTTEASIAANRNAMVARATSQSYGMAPQVEETTVLPPNSSKFAVPKGKSLTLPTGQIIEFLAVEQHQATYRIIDQAR